VGKAWLIRRVVFDGDTVEGGELIDAGEERMDVDL